MARRTAEERFWLLVSKEGPDECWEWRGCKQKGYGLFGADGRRYVAHRWLYESIHGPLTGDVSLVQLDHLCRNRGCVNPAHLEPVTRKENILRGEAPSAKNARKTHCKRGHPLSGPNLVIKLSGANPSYRACRICLRSTERARRHADGTWQGKLPNYERTHCPQGHPYSGGNLVVDRGRRRCRECRRAGAERYKLRSGRGAQGKRTHCPQGHPYSGENLITLQTGGRRCRECVKAQNKASYEKRRKK